MRGRTNTNVATLAGLVALLLLAPGPALSAGGLSESEFNRCRAIADEAARLRCFENMGRDTPAQAPVAPVGPPAAPASGSSSMGLWKLVRTPNPHGGKDAVSIMHASDFASSDPDFAGLIVRCGETDLEVLIAVISPFPLRARPRVTIKTGGSSQTFNATIAPPGALVLLPAEVTELARSTWPSLADITATVEHDDRPPVKGLVRLDGLQSALGALIANCPRAP